MPRGLDKQVQKRKTRRNEATACGKKNEQSKYIQKRQIRTKKNQKASVAADGAEMLFSRAAAKKIKLNKYKA